MPLSVSSNPHIAQTEPSKSNPYESVKHFGRKTLRWLGINQPPSLKALTETVKRQSETIQGQRSLSARVVDNLTGKAGNPFRSLSDKLAKNEAKLAVRSDPANFDQNKIEDIGFLLRDKTDEEIKEYFDKVPKHQVDRAIMKLAKTAKGLYGREEALLGSSDKLKLENILIWVGNGDPAKGDKIWKQMLLKVGVDNEQALDTKRPVTPLPVKKKAAFKEDSEKSSNIKETDRKSPKSKERQQEVNETVKEKTLLQKSVMYGRKSNVGTTRIQGAPRALGQGGVNQVYTDGTWALKKEESTEKRNDTKEDIAAPDCALLLKVPATRPNALGRNLAFYEVNCLLGKGEATVALEVKAVIHEGELYQAMKIAGGQPSNGRPISCEIGNPELFKKYKAKETTKDPQEALYYKMMDCYESFKNSKGVHGTRLDAYFEREGLGRGAKYDEDKKSFTFEVFDNHKSKVAKGEQVDCTNKFIEERIDWNDPKLKNLSEDLHLMCLITCQQDFNTGNYFLDVDAQGKCNNLQAIDRDFGFFENFDAIDNTIKKGIQYLDANKYPSPTTKKDVNEILNKPFEERTEKENIIMQKVFAESYLELTEKSMKLPLKITAETYEKYTQSFNSSDIEAICKGAGLGEAASFATIGLLEKIQDHIGRMEPVKNDKNEIIAWQVKGYNESDENRQNNLLLEIKGNMLNQPLRLDENNKPYLYDLSSEPR